VSQLRRTLRRPDRSRSSLDALAFKEAGEQEDSEPGHSLGTDGVYSIILHPNYLGLILNSLGWSLAFRSGVGVLVTAR